MADVVHTTFKFRVKDATVGKRLDRHARAVNFVWNYLCETQRRAELRWYGDRRVRWPSAFDFIKLTTGCAADLGIHSDTVAAVCRQFVASRDSFHKCPRFRASKGPKRALGWIPYIPRAVQIDGDRVRYKARTLRLWLSRPIEGVFVKGEFVCDARGRWYATFVCEIEADEAHGTGEVGVDLGLKSLATTSKGYVAANPRHVHAWAAKLATAQRAGRKARICAIHAKIGNARKDYLHKLSTQLVRENQLIVVGNVNAAGLAKSRMAKSVLDAGWAALRSQLAYKARRHGARYVEADERWTSQTCSSCNVRSGPKGLKGLGVREWTCERCGVCHDRDINAALNILGAEHRPPPNGNPQPSGQGRCYPAKPPLTIQARTAITIGVPTTASTRQPNL